MTPHDPFDATRDAALGRLLRDHLDAGDEAAFAARVRAAVLAERTTRSDTSWEVLARWARPGLAAAAAIVIGLGLWIATQSAGDVATLADAVQPVGAPTRLLAGGQGRSGDAVLASWMEGQ